MENTGLMVRINSGISSFGDLKGKKIAVIVGTTNETARDERGAASAASNGGGPGKGPP